MIVFVLGDAMSWAAGIDPIVWASSTKNDVSDYLIDE